MYSTYQTGATPSSTAANGLYLGAAALVSFAVAAVVTTSALASTTQLSSSVFARPQTQVRTIPSGYHSHNLYTSQVQRSAPAVTEARQSNIVQYATPESNSDIPATATPISTSWLSGVLALPAAVLAALGIAKHRQQQAPATTDLIQVQMDATPDAWPSRRQAMGTAAAVMLGGGALPQMAAAADSKTVGAYLPEYGEDDLYLFVPDKKETPSIRAGTIDPADPYSFAIPSDWKRMTVANAISGNYCQPKCGEPWTEVIFEGPSGKCQVIAGPLDKLTPKPDTPLSTIGTPDKVIYSVGPYITGTYIDEDSVVSAESKTINGRVYYDYYVDADYGTLPQHGLCSATTTGEVILLFIVSATEKQWANNEKQLRAVQQSFRCEGRAKKA